MACRFRLHRALASTICALRPLASTNRLLRPSALRRLRCAAAGMTDSRWYARLSAHGALKFMPLAFSRQHDIPRVHGTDERQALSSFRGGLCTTRRAMQLLGGLGRSSSGAGAAGPSGKEEL